MASNNLAQFTKGLHDFEVRVRSESSKTVRQVAFAIDRELVRRTPVGNPELWKINAGKKRGDPGFVGADYTGGRARANWLPSLETPSTEVVEEPDPTGTGPINKMAQVTAAYKLGQKIFISNNLEYIQPLDAGHSSQAPAGFVLGSIQTGLKTVLKR
jgi:hypothetical protein